MFGFGEKKFIGIDIGTSNVKMVELRIKGGRPVLSNYAHIFINGLMGDRDLKASYFETILPEYIKRMVRAADIDGREAYFSIPSFGGLITLIEFPNMSKEDLDQAIKFEAHKYIPISLDDVVLSWDIVGRRDSKKTLIKKNDEVADSADSPEGASGEGKVQVLLVAAPKNKVIKYEKLASDTNFHLKSIEIESFSLVRALIGNDQGNFVIVDIGSRICNIILVEKGVIKANRNMDAGGRDISKVIAKSMNIDDERADKLKTSGKNFLNAGDKMTFPVIDLIAGEISRVIGTYYKTDKTSVDGIILSGGTAGFPGLDEYFSKSLGIKTIVGNSLGRIEYDKRLEPKSKELGNQFSVAIGLALGGVDEHMQK